MNWLRRNAQHRVLTARPKQRRVWRTSFRLILGLAATIAVGTLILLLPGVATRPLPFNEALFTAVSALCVTGLTLINPAQDLTLPGQVILLALIQVGGVGFMAVAVVVLRLLGRTISLTDRIALRDSLDLPDLGGILQVTKRVLITVFTIEGIGALLLWWHWRGQLGDGRALLAGLFHAVSAFCNAGFDLFGGSIPDDPITFSISGALILLGGLGIPVLGDLLTWHRNRHISLHTRVTLTVVAVLVVVGTLGLFIAERAPAGTLSRLPWQEGLLRAAFQSVSARTAGFSGLPAFEQLTPAGQLLLIGLMFIGCAPASMGGGISTGTFAVLILGLFAFARGQSTPIIGGRAIPGGMIRRAAAVLLVSLFAVLTATWLILLTHPTGLDEALFEVISAFATCGLTLNFTPRLNIFGQGIIMVMMFWGRLGAFTLVVGLAQLRPQPPIIYPEGQLLIG